MHGKSSARVQPKALPNRAGNWGKVDGMRLCEGSCTSLLGYGRMLLGNDTGWTRISILGQEWWTLCIAMLNWTWRPLFFTSSMNLSFGSIQSLALQNRR